MPAKLITLALRSHTPRKQQTKPRTLRVETGFCSLSVTSSSLWSDVLDYTIYASVPRWWRYIEEKLRLDIILACHAQKIARTFDIVWADSEKVGIPLSLLPLGRPLVVVAHHCSSPRKRWLLRILNIPQRWARIGYWTDADRDFLTSYYGVRSRKLFSAAAPEFRPSASGSGSGTGPILSVGVSKRDYETLIRAARQLSGHEIHIYAASRYGDSYHKSKPRSLPSSVRFMRDVPHADMAEIYRRSRFVVIPLEKTSQYSVGLTVVAEAGAAGKAVIATKTPGMSSNIEDGVTGILVPPYDETAMEEAIRTLWERPELARQMGEAARNRIWQRYNPIQVNDVLASLLSTLAAECPTKELPGL